MVEVTLTLHHTKHIHYKVWWKWPWP